jgi:glutathione S-transferase
MTAPVLHDWVLSPSCYKVRLVAALLGVRLDVVAVDVHPGREHRSPRLLSLNPAGTLPILTHGDLVLTETPAMLTYLARLAGRLDWLGPQDPAGAARVQHWLAFSSGLTASLGGARLHEMLGRPGDIDALRARGVRSLREVEAALVENRLLGLEPFLVGDTASIADIAVFPYVMLAPDGGVSLDHYPSIRLWTRAVRALPGFVEMPGIHRLHDRRPEPGEEEAA